MRLLIVLPVLLLFCSCRHHKVHSTKFYNNIGEGNVKDKGYHANEANRLLEYNEQNKEVNEKHAEKAQQELSKDLNTLNQPNKYQSKPVKKKKKKFGFYH